MIAAGRKVSKFSGPEEQFEDNLSLRNKGEKAPSFDSFRLLPKFSYLPTFRRKWISHFGDKTEGGSRYFLPTDFLKVLNDQ
ncbi:hypothetical protein CEXT_42831 [Caerostris extrusa]|uniref:Uncharacterized protein n=1 Tax=Caerostris extrusa TaxID=172846 RepID=A0AAV4TUV3_CAEEX|nr:hypothetical protein CEXT_42831 [Caerostris extrusa]